MDLSITHQQSQRLLKQRNLLAITATGLFALSVVLTLTAARRDREVVLQPVLAKPLTLSSSHVDKDYLELVTRDAALLTLNRSPSNLQYWMDSILEITDPRTHGRMKSELMKIFNEQNGSNVSQFFTIENLSVEIMTVFNTAGNRAIMIGIALGIAATSLRVLLGVDRSHLGGDD